VAKNKALRYCFQNWPFDVNLREFTSFHESFQQNSSNHMNHMNFHEHLVFFFLYRFKHKYTNFVTFFAVFSTEKPKTRKSNVPKMNISQNVTIEILNYLNPLTVANVAILKRPHIRYTVADDFVQWTIEKMWIKKN
jgi:hypothetical protein